ncbi:MAG: hydrogenase, partial [Deltaproteobacteria bacterium]|nr:hydrogenase [Deltaproteobacteria bacterium]
MKSCVRIVAAQGIMLGALPILAMNGQPTLRIAILIAGGVVIRGMVFPLLLSRMLVSANIRREVEPYVGYTPSLLFGILAILVSIWLSSRLGLAPPALPPLAGPVAIFTILVGLFLIVSRKKAITQVLGYLVMENGIYVLGIWMVVEIPMLVELGVLLDAFVAVFVMGIATWQIRREFDHTDVDQLDSLKG